MSLDFLEGAEFVGPVNVGLDLDEPLHALSFSSFESDIVFDPIHHRLQHIDRKAQAAQRALARQNEEIKAANNRVGGEHLDDANAQPVLQPEIDVPEEVKPTRMRGSTRVLEQLFSPTYNFHECRHRAQKVRRTRHALGIDRDSIPRLGMNKHDKIKGRFAHHSLVLGDMVHAHVQAVINGKIIVSDHKSNLQWSVDPVLPDLLRSVGKISCSNRVLSHVHPIAQVFLVQMLQLGFRPLRAEVPVGIAALKMATLIDNMWVYEGKGAPPEGWIVLIELKKYESFYYHANNDWLGEPYQDIRNSPHNKHQIQLGWATWMYTETFKDVPELFYGRCDMQFVVRVCTRGIQFYKLQPWVLEERRARIAQDRNYDYMNVFNDCEERRLQLLEARERQIALAEAAEAKMRQEAKDAARDEKEGGMGEIREERAEAKRIQSEQKAERERRAENRKRTRDDFMGDSFDHIDQEHPARRTRASAAGRGGGVGGGARGRGRGGASTDGGGAGWRGRGGGRGGGRQQASRGRGQRHVQTEIE